MSSVTAEAWLAQKWKGNLPFPYEDASRPTIPDAPEPTVLQVLAAIVYRNGGGDTVSGYGCTTGGGIYFHSGIEQQEAFALMSLGAYLRGLLDAVGRSPHELNDLFDAEWDRVAKLRPELQDFRKSA